MKTLADLKRDAKSGRISGEMVIRMGSTDIPETLKGRRKIVDANTVGIKFLNNNGKKSELRISCASLVEYDNDSLTIYSPALRELNDDEKQIMSQWQEIANTEEYQKQSEIDLLTDGSSTYWKRKHFFVDKGYAYLLGHEKLRGMKYDYNTGMVKDDKIKGEIELQYKIYRN
jgi:hypothetical protein